MKAAAHNKAFSDSMQIPQSVAREYVAADKKTGKPRKKKGR
jgi:hypothetical protein